MCQKRTDWTGSNLKSHFPFCENKCIAFILLNENILLGLIFLFETTVGFGCICLLNVTTVTDNYSKRLQGLVVCLLWRLIKPNLKCNTESTTNQSAFRSFY